MKHALLLTIVATLLGLTLAGCTDDISLNLSGQSQFDEGELVEAPLALSVTTFSVSTTRGGVESPDDGGTRAGEEKSSDDTEPVTDLEKEVDNIWVFQYGTDGNLLIKPRYYTAKVSETDGTWSVMLKPSVASKIYVVANVGNETWASAYNDFATDALLLKQTLPSPYPVIPGSSEESAIPMEGVNDGENNAGVTVSPEQTEPVVVPVTRMYAKIKVKVNIDKELEADSASVYYVTLRNIPWYCQVSTLYAKENMSQPATYPDDKDTWITRAINEKNDTDAEDHAEGYDYVFYIPENIQGVEESSTDSSTKTENAPTNATRLTVRISYIDYTEEADKESSGVQSFADYTVCPGGNSVDNYNIRRNCVYRVTLNIGYPIEPSYQPSANCIYAAPGSTVYFEPYYRTETGGGYNFSDYLDPEVEGKQIKGVKILWQTEDCIGDNTSGDLVYFEPLKNNTEQTLHSRIYVTVKEPGNAVIAAYADAECSGDIIWSWHIWVPDATEPDPTNEANGLLYYTYEWDSDSIYGLYSSRARIPGYTIMNLNLGALGSYPPSSTSRESIKTYGMLYQWGRKDPFPGAKGAAAAGKLTGGSTSWGSYDAETTEQLYGNNGTTEILMTANNAVEEEDIDDYLFHSVSGLDMVEYSYAYGVPYSIAHPTVFMCGTDYAWGNENNNANTGHYVNSTTNYTFEGDWMPTQFKDDRLWGATPVEEGTKTYYIGLDNNKKERHLYDDYGEKSIYDPCPYGWRVPPPDLWLGFTDTGLNPPTDDWSDHVNYSGRHGDGMNMYLQGWRTGATSYFPTQGARCPDGCLTHSIACGNYHNATADSDNRVNILHIHNGANFHIFEMTYVYYYMKSVAGPVRCVRETR